jgi:hypothetical protein
MVNQLSSLVKVVDLGSAQRLLPNFRVANSARRSQPENSEFTNNFIVRPTGDRTKVWTGFYWLVIMSISTAPALFIPKETVIARERSDRSNLSHRDEQFLLASRDSFLGAA